jgi:intracellular multiplication protein IcmE
MVEKMKKMPAGFADTKTRSVLIIIIIILIMAVIIGYISYRRATKEEVGAVTEIARPPEIRAIPGVGTPPSREYTRLQQQKSREEAEEALREKGVALPTPIRPTYVGDEQFLIPTAKPGEPLIPGCSVEELQRARKAGVSAFELRCRGCDAAALKAAGYTAGELRDAGFTAAQLRDAGFTAAQLKAAGFSAQDLKDAGFTAQELKDAGFSAQELKKAGFSDANLQAAGFSAAEIAKKVSEKNCTVDALSKTRANGISAAELKYCGAAALKAAGYTAKELKDAGFTAGELRDAGFSAENLKDAGFTAKQLKDAGFNADDLKNAGFSANELKDAGFTDGDLIRAGYSPEVAVKPPVTAPIAPIVPPSFVTLAPTPEAGIQTELAQIRKQQAAQLSKQEWEDKMRELQQDMQTQASDLFSSWTPLPKQEYVEGAPPLEATAATKAIGTIGVTGQQQAVSGKVMKAGSIIFAVLDTGINSDEPGPIMATVTESKLKGSKVLGEFKRAEKRVVLQFSVMSVPQLDHSISINAYGIDPEIGRIAMASSVDNHYMYRYGTYFAASFIGGLGDAIQNSKSTIITNVWGGTTQQFSDLSVTEKIFAALGEVGQKFSDVLKKDIDMPPTVRVKTGSGIGLLLMSDLTIPQG